MEIKKMQLSELKPLEKNVRIHGERQIEELAKSVTQFGQTRAIVTDEEGNILIGNGLYAALVKLGRTEADVGIVTGLSETDKKKLILTDNKVYEMGYNDFATIEDYIGEIVGVGDLEIPGYDPEFLEKMVRTESEVDEDIMEYGKLPEPVPFTPSAPSRPASAAPSAPAPAHQEQPEPPAQPVKTVRKVICPNCGEVIVID